ncbi:MAG TPA: DUF1365 domain-containing protein [Acidobacteriota bacterium]|nr:DUF1365 domain-containing protein [Acidobacteriota bacterium]
MNSCLYECRVMHQRIAPKPHRFDYRLFYFAIDLDELDALHSRLRLFSINRANLYSLRESDFFPTHEPLHNSDGDSRTEPLGPPRSASTAPPAVAPYLGLKARITAWLANRGIDLTDGRILLVTLPRVAGYLFNPVSFYFCFDRAGAPVTTIAEVTNTFREVKPFHVNERVGATTFHLRAPKNFYVSPFSDVDVEFAFTLRTPGQRLAIQIDDYTGEARTLISTLHGARATLTDARLAWFTLKYPLLTLRIITLIHWHALRLWLKRIRWFAKADRAAEQRDLYRPHNSLASAKP